jgi:hypothetical protein
LAASVCTKKNVQTVEPEIAPALAASLTATIHRFAAVVVQVALVQGMSIIDNIHLPERRSYRTCGSLRKFSTTGGVTGVMTVQKIYPGQR